MKSQLRLGSLWGAGRCLVLVLAFCALSAGTAFCQDAEPGGETAPIVEPLPAEALPDETLPAEAPSTEAVPPEAPPAEAPVAEELPAEAPSTEMPGAEAVPPEPVPAEAPAAEELPKEASSTETLGAEAAPPEPATAASPAVEPVPVLKMARLWSARITPSRAPQLLGTVLCIETLPLFGQGASLHALAAKDGVELWVYPLNAPLDFPVSSDGKLLYAIASNMLHVINIEKGTSEGKGTLSFAPSSAAAPDRDGAWVMGWDHTLYHVNRKAETGRAIPIDVIVTAPPLVRNTEVIVGGEDGLVRGFKPYQKKKPVWTTSVQRAVRAAPVANSTMIFVGCDAYSVYALDILNGTVFWQALVQGPIEHPLYLLGDDLLLACASRDRLVALNTKDGSQRWSVPGGIAPVAVGKDLLIVQVGLHGLVAVDPKSGEILWSHPAMDIQWFVPNAALDVIYAVARGGGVTAIRLAE